MVIALDVGTSSARAGLYDAAGRPVADRFHQVPYEPRVTADGGVEHDPVRLLDAVAACLDAVTMRPRRDGDILGVGVTTFWHGLLGFDAADRPATPVYMWADSRAAREAARLRETLDEAALHARTGCHLHSSYWPAKLRWLARDEPAILSGEDQDGQDRQARGGDPQRLVLDAQAPQEVDRGRMEPVRDALHLSRRGSSP